MAIRSVLTAVALALTLGACATTISGTALPGSSGTAAPGPDNGDIPTYREPSDGGGFGTQPLDQPLPLPVKGSRDACAWAESTLPGLGASRSEDTGSGCQFDLGGGQGVQVRLFGPYGRITQDTALLRPVEIAGFTGRVYAFDEPPVTFCSVELDIRSYASLTVDGYDLASDESGDREAHCELARRAAEVIVKTFAPLSGGTPWPTTRQQPADDVLARTDVCEVVRFTDVFYGGISAGRDDGQKGTTALGPTCQYHSDYATATVQIVTNTGGLSALPKRDGARGRDGRFGVLPSRTEQTTDKCLFSVQFGNGQVLQLEFAPAHRRDHPITCLSAQVILASAISSLITNDF